MLPSTVELRASTLTGRSTGGNASRRSVSTRLLQGGSRRPQRMGTREDWWLWDAAANMLKGVVKEFYISMRSTQMLGFLHLSSRLARPYWK